MNKRNVLLTAAAIGCILAGPAFAHVGLAVTVPAAGSTSLFGFGIGHGCGLSPTIAVRIQVPAGIESVQPVAKPGWEIAIVTGADGAVTEIHFTGGSLPNEWYDQFWIRARINAELVAGTPIYFPVVQECAEGAHLWLDIPAPGGAESEEPAPGFTVETPAAGGHAH